MFKKLILIVRSKSKSSKPSLGLDAVEPDGAGARVDEVEEGDADRALPSAGPAAYPDLVGKIFTDMD